MRRNFVPAGAAVLAAVVVLVLLVNGTDEAGMRAAIRATARTSALCVGLAVARIRAREFSALLPVSHALHYALIVAAGLTRDWLTFAVGIAVFAVMLWNAIRPHVIALYTLWIVFLAAFVRPGVLYVTIIGALLGCGVVRWIPRGRETIA